MRLLAFVLLASACTASDPLPPELPAATEIAGNVTSVAVHGAELYWTEEYLDIVSVVHLSADGPRILWQERRLSWVYHLLAGEEGVIFEKLGAALESCGNMLLLRRDGSSEQLALVEQGTCHTLALDQTAGALLYAYSPLAPGPPATEVRRYDLASRTSERCFDADGFLYEPTPKGDHDFAMATALGGGYIAQFPRDRPWYMKAAARNIRDFRGLAVVDQHVYWADNGYAGDQVTLRRAALDADLGPELVATLPKPVSNLTSVGDALWLSESEEPTTLVRLDSDGIATRYEVPYRASSLKEFGDALLIIAAQRLLLQPLP